MRRCMVGIALVALAGSAEAQNLTQFTPDIVMECRETRTGKLSSRCEYQCFTIPRPADNATSSWPPITWSFERLEFFSKSGRESESWLIAIKGRPQSLAVIPDTVFFITLGHSFLCVYTAGPLIAGVDPAEVKLLKYY